MIDTSLESNVALGFRPRIPLSLETNRALAFEDNDPLLCAIKDVSYCGGDYRKGRRGSLHAVFYNPFLGCYTRRSVNSNRIALSRRALVEDVYLANGFLLANVDRPTKTSLKSVSSDLSLHLGPIRSLAHSTDERSAETGNAKEIYVGTRECTFSFPFLSFSFFLLFARIALLATKSSIDCLTLF